MFLLNAWFDPPLGGRVVDGSLPPSSSVILLIEEEVEEEEVEEVEVEEEEVEEEEAEEAADRDKELKNGVLTPFGDTKVASLCEIPCSLSMEPCISIKYK